MNRQESTCRKHACGHQWLLSLLIGVLLSPAAGLAEEPKPPPPNPADPVNYIEWINKTYGAGIRDNAWDTYRLAFKELKPLDG